MLLEDNSVLSSLTVCRKSYSYFKWKTQHNVTDRGVHAAKCVFTLWTVCTYFLVVVLDCPCMLFLQLEAGTWHDEVDWDSDIKKPLLSHDSLAVLQTWDSTSITRSCPCWNFLCRTNDESRGGGVRTAALVSVGSTVRAEAHSPRLLEIRKDETDRRLFFFQVLIVPSAGVMLVVMALLLLLLGFFFKSVSTSSSSLNEFFPYRSFHQARYWKGRAEGES